MENLETTVVTDEKQDDWVLLGKLQNALIELGVDEVIRKINNGEITLPSHIENDYQLHNKLVGMLDTTIYLDNCRTRASLALEQKKALEK